MNRHTHAIDRIADQEEFDVETELLKVCEIGPDHRIILTQGRKSPQRENFSKSIFCLPDVIRLRQFDIPKGTFYILRKMKKDVL